MSADPSGTPRPPARNKQLVALVFDLIVVLAIVVLVLRMTSGMRDRTDTFIVTGIGCACFVGTRLLLRYRRSKSTVDYRR